MPSSGRIVLILLICLSALLRLYRLDWQGIWSDEAFTIYSAALDFTHFRKAMAFDPYPPLYNFLIWQWVKLAGPGEYAVRLISVVFGVAAVPLVYLLARRLLGRGEAMLAVILFATSQMMVQYSQEARCYTQLCFLVLLAAWLYVRAWDVDSRANWFAFSLCGAAILWTHYYGLFPLLAIGCHWLAFRRETRIAWRHWIAFSAIAFGPFLLWAVQVPLANPPRLRAYYTRESEAPRVASVVGAINRIHNGKTEGLESQSPAWTIPAGLLLFAAPALWAAGRAWRDRKIEPARWMSIAFLTAMAALPMALPICVSKFGILFAYRYLLAAAPPYYMLTASGLLHLPSRPWRAAMIFLVLGYSLYSLRTNYTVPYRETFRDGWRYFFSRYSPQDCASTAPKSWASNPHWSWYAYAGQRPYPTAIDRPGQLDEHACQFVWFIRDQNSFAAKTNMRPDAVLQRLQRDYQLVDSQRFSALEVQQYRRND